jgi:hypothetical protein
VKHAHNIDRSVLSLFLSSSVDKVNGSADTTHNPKEVSLPTRLSELSRCSNINPTAHTHLSPPPRTP